MTIITRPRGRALPSGGGGRENALASAASKPGVLSAAPDNIQAMAEGRE